ncbi:MAG TPA: hypothetical protein VF698_10800 [Thermoanaerobaculia bacterium]|jgi:hypothetical protein
MAQDTLNASASVSSPRSNDPIDLAAAAYAEQLRGDINRVSSRLDKPPGVLPVLPEQPTWTQLFNAEADLIRWMPEPDLKRHAWIVYDRFADVAGPEKVARYMASKGPDASSADVDIDLLRADLLQVHSETARYYVLGQHIEVVRSRVSSIITIIAVVALLALSAAIAFTFPGRTITDSPLVVVVAILLVAAAIAWVVRTRAARTGVGALLVGIALLSGPRMLAQDPAPTSEATTQSAEQAATPTETQPAATQTTTQAPADTRKAASKDAQPASDPLAAGPTLVMVALAGILGATFSILQRTQRSTANVDPVRALFALNAARSQVFLSLISGTIAALILYAVFAGDMINGSLFPNIVNGKKATDGAMQVVHFFQFTGPASHADHGKLLVWAFVAGFAERLVPDILDRFSASANK